ncbi:hypothetical protein N8364_04390 [Saprospiraceae bacterium]|nr:hypothetical protein [Saprospiraceae bacterium]MDC1508893.1 hypothetical protein [Saprospiraceae bacterium]
MGINKNVIFVGGARDYHAMDWYRNAQDVCQECNLLFAVDLIGGEGFEVITKDTDQIIELFIIDKYLFGNQSSLGDKWRNIFKLLVLRKQARKLKDVARKYPNSVYHAHGMYYMLICMLAGVDYIGTPQGSEVLVRPHRSKLYRKYAAKALSAAKAVTVDSVRMADQVQEIAGREAVIIQNGVDIPSILDMIDGKVKRDIVFSHRGFTPLYRIDEMLKARNTSLPSEPIHFVYPFWDDTHKLELEKIMISSDQDLGRVPREKLYSLLNRSKLVLSIPISDSSPRSVYEAIFSGACVGIRPNAYVDILPSCMKARIIELDLDNPNWFADALAKTKALNAKPYEPSAEALRVFDEKKSMQLLAEKFYY